MAMDSVAVDIPHNRVETSTQLELHVVKRDCKNMKERLEGAIATISFQAKQIKINEQQNAQNTMHLQQALEENRRSTHLVSRRKKNYIFV